MLLWPLLAVVCWGGSGDRESLAVWISLLLKFCNLSLFPLPSPLGSPRWCPLLTACPESHNPQPAQGFLCCFPASWCYCRRAAEGKGPCRWWPHTGLSPRCHLWPTGIWCSIKKSGQAQKHMGSCCVARWCHCSALSRGISSWEGPLLTEEQPMLKMQWEKDSAAEERCWLPPKPTFDLRSIPPAQPVTLQCPAHLLVQQSAFHANWQFLADYLFCTTSCL